MLHNSLHPRLFQVRLQHWSNMAESYHRLPRIHHMPTSGQRGVPVARDDLWRPLLESGVPHVCGGHAYRPPLFPRSDRDDETAGDQERLDCW